MDLSNRKKNSPDPRFGYTDLQGVSMITGLSYSSLYKLVALGKIPVYKPSGQLIFKIEEIKVWIEEASQRPG